MSTSFPRSTLLHLPSSGHHIKCLNKLSKCCQCWSGWKRMHLWHNDCQIFQCDCSVILILAMMHDQKSWTLHWSSFSRWGRERVSLLFDYIGGQYIKQWQWRTKVNSVQLTLGYLNATINWKSRNPEPEIWSDWCSQTSQNSPVDG